MSSPGGIRAEPQRLLVAPAVVTAVLFLFAWTAMPSAGVASGPTLLIAQALDDGLGVVDAQPQLPVRAAFYYPWFPEAWSQNGITPYTHYQPSLGSYDSDDLGVIEQHIVAMQYGRIQVGIASWWGVGSRTDGRIDALLAAAAATDFRWTVYVESEGYGDPSATQLASDLAYLQVRYGGNPAFFLIGGRFVVFVYAGATDGCAMAERWVQANQGIGAYLVLKVFSGYRSCAFQPDAWHQYGPAVAADSQAGYSYAISPGFYLADEAAPRLGRDLVRWAQNVRDMISSGAPFQLITTFNEWGEGTSVESAAEWATASGFGAYLDVLHANGSPDPTPSPSPFTDIADSPFISEIVWLYNEGITTGCTPTTFCPTASVSREQMASFLVRALGLPATGTDFFTDDESSIHESDINRLAAAGIATGCGGGYFCPTQIVTREQMASFLVRAFGYGPTATDFFTDDETSIHESDINRLAASGVTGGCGGGYYCPLGPVTREQMAAFLFRTLS